MTLGMLIWSSCRAWNFLPLRQKRGTTLSGENSITVEAARKRLELKFYKFAEINWLPLEEAVAESETTQRPIHAVLAWGPLDDESC